MSDHHDPQAIVEALRFIVGENIAELRALDATTSRDRWPRTLSGYFDDPEILASAVGTIRSAKGIHITFNPVEPALIARAHNRIKPAAKSESTQDSNITRRRWLLIDVDANRPAGISATDVEHDAARATGCAIRDYLANLGWPDPVVADSGNGAHLLYPIDLPTEDNGLVQRCLTALAERFDDDRVEVDQSVFNPARLTKLYGTRACKGDDTPDRPHRMARILARPDTQTAVPVELLESLAGEGAPPSTAGTSPRYRPIPTPQGQYDVADFIQRHGLDLTGPDTWTDKNGHPGQRWVFKVCPWNPAHDDGAAYLVQFDNGAIAAGCHHNGCTGKDWRDLRAIYEPIEAVASGVRPKVRPLPDDIAERMQCPPDFPAAALVVVLGSGIGRRCGIRPRRQDDWLVAPNLWGGVIGRPSLLKTPAIKNPLGLLDRLETEARKAFEEDHVEHAKKTMLADAQKKIIEQQLRSAVKDKEADTSAILKELDECVVKQPVRERYLTNDTTVEKLGEILADNHNGVMVFRDELVGWLNNLEKEGQQGSRAFYLEAWDGTGRFTYDRIGRGTVEIESAVVSVFGGIQPGRLAPYVRAAVDGGGGDDGLIQRFQILVWPDTPKQWRNVDRWPDSDARRAVIEVVERLNQIDVESIGGQVDIHDPARIPFLRFDEPAQQVFDAWRKNLELWLRSGDDHPAIEAHLGKYRSLIPSLALIFHLAEHERGPVGLPALELAIRWGEYLESHARRVYGAVTTAEVVAAKAIWRRVCRGELKGEIAARELYRRGWTGLTDPEEVKHGLALLAEYGHLIGDDPEQDLRSTGRPRSLVRYTINPLALRKQASNPTDKTDETRSVSFVSDPEGHSRDTPGDDWGEA